MSELEKQLAQEKREEPTAHDINVIVRDPNVARIITWLEKRITVLEKPAAAPVDLIDIVHAIYHEIETELNQDEDHADEVHERVLQMIQSAGFAPKTAPRPVLHGYDGIGKAMFDDAMKEADKMLAAAVDTCTCEHHREYHVEKGEMLSVLGACSYRNCECKSFKAKKGSRKRVKRQRTVM